MENVFKTKRTLVITVLLAAGITAFAQQNNGNQNKTTDTDILLSAGDTTEPRKRNTDKDDWGLSDIHAALKEMNVEMQRLNQEMKKLNLEKLNADMKLALREVDLEKMNKELRTSLKEIDFPKMRVEIDKSLREAELSMKKVDLTEMSKEMKRMQKDLTDQNLKLKFNAEEIRDKVEKEMEKAKESMRKAETDMKLTREFINVLDKDGLINKNKNFTIKLKDGVLFINGKEQSKATTDKYKEYYRGKSNFTIRINNDDDGDTISL